MLDDMRKISRRSVIKHILLIILLIIALLFISKNSLQKWIDGPKDMDSLSINQLPKSYVKADIRMIYSNFAEYYLKDEEGSETVTDQYYIIPVGEKEFIGLVVDSDDSDKAQKIYDETYEYFDGKRDAENLTTNMKVTGTINKMDDEAYQYYHDWFKTSGYLENPTEKEIREIALPYVLQIGYIGRYDSAFLYIFLFLIAALTLCLVIIIIKCLTGFYLREIKKYLRNNESFVSQERLELDYLNAAQVGTIRVGNDFIYYLHNSKIKMIAISDIIWAYTQNVTHRTYGIKIWVHRLLIIYTKDNKRHSISMRKMELIDHVLELISQKQPNAVLGYSDKLKKLFMKDRNAFLNQNTNSTLQ